jgi:glycosyltransferase involved in cell wall biosynthesis
MKKIVFLAPYPNSENIKEGMMQRVSAIDEMFSNYEYDKTYIVPRFKTFKTRIKQVDINTIEFNLSIWRSFSLLIKEIKKADIIYSHSLYGIGLAGIFCMPLIKNKNFVWDVHGIIPEEIRLSGQSKLKQFIYSLLESLVIKNASKIIVVTNAMKNHLCLKYKDVNAKFFVYPILPNTIDIKKGFEESDAAGKINIIYAGNMQGYQNIPLMIQSIKDMLYVPNVYFYILTGEKVKMLELFETKALNNKKNIFIDSVKPSELNKYYKKAHYGFILRDDVVVNNVACPTKIIEYLAYGLTCITLTSKIGDFETLGFDHLNLNQLNKDQLKASKSLKNNQIYCNISSENTPSNLISFILKS